MNFISNFFYQTMFKTALVGAMLLGCMAEATQVASPYTYATRYDVSGRVTGTISPDPDARGLYLATRNTYHPTRGLLLKTEELTLSSWPQNEMEDSAAWAVHSVARVTETTYDDRGRKATVSIKDSGGSAYSLTQFSYDAFDRIECSAQRMNRNTYGSLPLSACTLGAAGAFGEDRITKYEYNNFGQVTKEWRALGTPDQQLYATNTYNTQGQLTDQTDANGNLTHLQYDSVGRLEIMNFPSKTTVGNYSTSDFEQYGYDNNGNRTSLRKRDGQTIYYAYDDLNRMTLKDVPGSTKDVHYGYNLLNHQLYARFGSTTGLGNTSIFNGYGEQETENSNLRADYPISYLYDANGNRTKVTIANDGGYNFGFAYDKLDRQIQLKDTFGTPVVITRFNNNGRAETQTTNGKAVTGLAYDAVSRLDSMTHTFPTAATYNASTKYGYTPANQLRSLEVKLVPLQA